MQLSVIMTADQTLTGGPGSRRLAPRLSSSTALCL